MITSLKGANVVVMGGSRGLGSVVVTAAHREGAHVLPWQDNLSLSLNCPANCQA
jgi:NAD(P)-dependent dehydrogenase (short-subunit alcohol dehydrogenase family)